MSSISYKTFLSGLALGLIFATPALAGTISVNGAEAEMEDNGKDAADLFMEITNSGNVNDRLYAVRTKVADRVHFSATSEAEEEEAEAATGSIVHGTTFAVPAGQTIVLSEDGPHLEMTGLKGKLKAGDTFEVTLFFEKAGRVKVEVEVEEEDH